MSLIKELDPEVAKKIREVEARAQRCLIRNSNPLLKDQTLNTAFETCAIVVGINVQGIFDMSMMDLVLSCYPFKEQKNVLDYIATYHRYLWKHVETLIEGYETLQLNLQMHFSEQDKLLKVIAKEITERKIFQQFLKEQHIEDLYARWKKDFEEK